MSKSMAEQSKSLIEPIKTIVEQTKNTQKALTDLKNSKVPQYKWCKHRKLTDLRVKRATKDKEQAERKDHQ